MHLNKQKGDCESRFLAGIPSVIHTDTKEGLEGWHLRTALVKSLLVCHSPFSEHFGSL